MTAVLERLDITEEGIYPDLSDAVRIPVGPSHFALVDAADAHKVQGVRWSLLRGHNGKLYAHRRARGKGFYMHRIIAETPAGYETDHVNGDGLDNRRLNLRTATLSQNSANTGKPRRFDGRAHTSRFKGVSWSQDRRKWVAYITVAKRSRYLGGYESETEAARVYDAAALGAWGEFARLNLPRVTS